MVKFRLRIASNITHSLYSLSLLSNTTSKAAVNCLTTTEQPRVATGDIVAHAQSFGGCFEGASILQGHHHPSADLHVILLLTPDGHIALLQSSSPSPLQGVTPCTLSFYNLPTYRSYMIILYTKEQLSR